MKIGEKEIPLKYSWLIFIAGTATCYRIYLMQAEALRNWHPSPGEYEAPLENFDLLLMIWAFVGTWLFIVNIIGTGKWIYGLFNRRVGKNI